MLGSYAEPQTYLDVYNLTIAPKLKELDVFLKSKEVPITIWQASQLLDISYDEVEALIHKMKIKKLDYQTVFTLMLSGSSRLCRLLQREIERGFPIYYSPEDIAFIYEIDVKKIERVFDALGFTSVKSSLLPAVLDLLPAEDF